MSDEPHAAALLGLLDGIPQPVHDGAVPNPTPPRPYVVAYVTVETLEQTNLTSQSDVTTARIYCHCVATSAEGARIVQADVAAALLNARPVVSGRSLGLVRQEQSLPPQRDETTGVVVMDAVSVYRLVTHPA